MSSRLAVLIFIEFERAPLTKVLELLEEREGTRLWGEGNRFIFKFKGPTGAIVAAEAVLRYLLTHDNHDQVKCYIDTSEVSFDGPVPVGSVVNLGWILLARGNWNMVYFSDSTRLALRYSEHQFLSRPEEWLERGIGKVSVFRLVLNYSESRLGREEEHGEHFENLEALVPAPHGRRVLAGLADLLLALGVLLLIRISMNAPMVYAVMSHRKVIEAESMNIQHGYITPMWLASSGAAVELGIDGLLSVTFPYETGRYKVRIVYRNEDLFANLKVGIGERLFDFTCFKRSPLFSDDFYRENEIWGDFIAITHGEVFSIKNVQAHVGTPEIDYVQFIAPGEQQYPREGRNRFLRFEDILRLIGVWEYDDLKYHLRDLFVICPAIQLALQILFLSFVPWTPGALLAGIRIVRKKGPRVPGVFKALQRVLGYVLSVVPFAGVGLVWPVVVNRSENWADIFSQTRVITSGAGVNEE